MSKNHLPPKVLGWFTPEEWFEIETAAQLAGENPVDFIRGAVEGRIFEVTVDDVVEEELFQLEREIAVAAFQENYDRVRRLEIIQALLWNTKKEGHA